MAFSSDSAIAHDLAIIAQAAAAVPAPYLRTVARTPVDVAIKTDIHDPVTVHDKRVEQALHTVLGSLMPGSHVLGEEIGEILLPTTPQRPTPEFTKFFGMPTTAQVVGAAKRCQKLADRVRWIVDPIDGTSNFAAGMAWFNTSIGVELDGKVVAGAIYSPMTHRAFVADAEQAWTEGTTGAQPLKANGPHSEGEAVLVAYYPNMRSLESDPQRSLEHELRLHRAYQSVRRTGASALDLAMIAAGWAGTLIAVALRPWDVAAGIHMIRVAGGHVRNAALGTRLPDGLRPGVVAYGANMKADTALDIMKEIEQAWSNK